MSELKQNLKYSKEHEWVEVLGENKVRVGITDYAQHSLGDIVFVEVPEEGSDVSANETMGSVESVKAVSDVYTPVSGKVVEVNEDLEDAPEVINEDPYGKGWMVVIELSNPSELDQLLSAEEYEAFIKEEE
ncbi:glycine cleavage system protein GcvH [Tepidibacillus infernus]|uniref:Glycine cleavage system H protein n=1 Tax=Tepidibacillus decaturensis TaxID=1413211 RepID=A0A135L2L1_9BACI|nr:MULTISPECIES: glycine cleavage system protein GcvH [Tepidibacillus]KXG43258.1 glycine cleavage system protein H [Tepidibacillus decaturensis]GBF11001.1 glycine cleavage system H protein [Tepidibacillus sp. HK-1]